MQLLPGLPTFERRNEMVNFFTVVVCSLGLGIGVSELFFLDSILFLSLCFFFLFTGLKVVISAGVKHAQRS